jgi:hypothetical protein
MKEAILLRLSDRVIGTLYLNDSRLMLHTESLPIESC